MFRNTALAALVLAGGLVQAAPALAAPPPGQTLYADNCAACHQATGKGVKGAYPALAGTPLVQGDAKPLLAMVLNGKNEMPGFKDDLTDADLAGLLTYVRASWGNKGKAIAPAEVATARRRK
ncbi:cytochrome C [Caulobacter flavus]|uniref:Cytochrome C n=1 Tax=Caulobacter flavus TaxID=1679497 RepID=A0A2N5D4Z1_9CAUL|nr:cytochrome c [Caulobacter flavus]AYV47172.1 cytochrome C [Caulobacter flavus]PLR21148.1 cytochrome C [Caulobacter flavus]